MTSTTARGKLEDERRRRILEMQRIFDRAYRRGKILRWRRRFTASDAARWARLDAEIRAIDHLLDAPR